MNETEFNEMLETQLGGNLVDVELQPKDYSFAYDRAKKTFIQKGNNNLEKKFVPLVVDRETKEYNLDENIDTVVRIIKPSGGFYSSDPFSIAIFNDIFRELGMGEGELLNFELGKQTIERIQRYSAYDNDFIYNRRTNQLQLLKKPEQNNQTWFLETYSNLTDEEYRDNLWVQQWAAAELKIILGRAYSKFQNVPTPAGDSSLPGSDLMQEGQQDKERLIEDIKNFVDGDETGLFIMMG